MKSPLMQRISEVQDRACLLNGLLEAVNYLTFAEECSNGRASICLIAEEMSLEIYEALDSKSLKGLEDAA